MSAGSALDRSWVSGVLKNPWPRPGAPPGRKGERFQGPEGRPGGPQSLPESFPEAILRGTSEAEPCGPEKVINNIVFDTFSKLVFVMLSAAFGRRRRESDP